MDGAAHPAPCISTKEKVLALLASVIVDGEESVHSIRFMQAMRFFQDKHLKEPHQINQRLYDFDGRTFCRPLIEDLTMLEREGLIKTDNERIILTAAGRAYVKDHECACPPAWAGAHLWTRFLLDLPNPLPLLAAH